MPHPSQLSSSDHRLQQIVRYWNGCLRLVGPLPEAAIQGRLSACYRHLGFAAPRHLLTAGSPLGGALLASWLHDYRRPEASELVDMIFDLNKLLLQETRDWALEQLPEKARQAIQQSVISPFNECSDRSVSAFVQRAIWRDTLHAQYGRGGAIWQQVAQSSNNALAVALPGLADLGLGNLEPDTESVVEASMQAGLGSLGACELAEIEAAAALLGPSPHFWTVLPLRQIARVCSMYWLFDDVAIATHLPEQLHLDAEGRPHCEDGPALVYPDGWALWAWHGVRVSQATIEAPDSLTVTEVAREPDLETRRIMLGRMGLDHDAGLLSALRIIAQNDDMSLYQADWMDYSWEREAGAFKIFLQCQKHRDPSRRHFLQPVAAHCDSLPDALDWLAGTETA